MQSGFTLPQFGAIDLALSQPHIYGKFLAIPPKERIGTTYFPAMNAMRPIPKGIKGLTLSEVRKMTAARGGISDTPLPDSFNWANPDDVRRYNKGNPEMISPPGNQGQCGSCYAYSSCSALADRWSLITQVPCPRLSTDIACSCYKGPNYNGCCTGGDPYYVGKLFEDMGVPSEDCVPYSAVNGTDPQCPTKIQCQGKSDKVPLWKAIKGSTQYLTITDHVPKDDELASEILKIKTALFHNGPLVCAFWVPSDFMEYKSGIYKDAGKDIAGGHAVVIVGYGPDHWIIRNSWTTSFGEGGYARVYDGLHGNHRLGFDHCVPVPGSSDNANLLGGAYVWMADRSSGVPLSGDRGGGGGLWGGNSASSIWYILAAVLLLIVVGYFVWWRSS